MPTKPTPKPDDKPDPDPKPDDKPDPDPDDKPDPDPKDEVAKWKAMARKHEQQSKANAKAAEKLKELEDAGKSEIEKATAAAAEAHKRAEEAELKAIRLEVAAEKGLTPAQAKRLVGATKEELDADADELLEEFGGPSDDGKKPPARKPSERLKGGTADEDEPPELDTDKVLAKIPRL